MPRLDDPLTPANWPLIHRTPASDAWVACIGVFGLDPSQVANTPYATPPVVTFGKHTATLEADVFHLDEHGHRVIDYDANECVLHRVTRVAPIDAVLHAVIAS